MCYSIRCDFFYHFFQGSKHSLSRNFLQTTEGINEAVTSYGNIPFPSSLSVSSRRLVKVLNFSLTLPSLADHSEKMRNRSPFLSSDFQTFAGGHFLAFQTGPDV